MDDDETVDLTLSTPRAADAEATKCAAEEKDAVISLLTPKSPTTKRRQYKRRTPGQRGLTATTLLRKKLRENDEAADDRSQTQPRRSSSPVAGALRQYLSSRLASDVDLYPVRIPSDLLSPPQKNILPGGNRVERVAQDVEERTLSAEKLKKSLPKRRVLYQGDDAIIIEICRATEESPVAAALVRALDDAKKQNISFCCHTQTTAPPVGRKCVSWLQKEQRKSSSQTATHGIIPYRVILLEAAEFIEELSKDKLQSLLRRVSRYFPDSKVGLIIIGLEAYLRIKKTTMTVPYTMRQVEASMVDTFVKLTGIVYRMVISMAEAAEHIIQLTRAFLRIANNDYDVSFLTVFGGCKMTEAIKTVDLRLSTESTEESQEEMLEWINMLTAVPGISPKDAHGIALVYPTFLSLLDAYSSPERSEEEKKLLVTDIRLPPRNDRRIGDAASTSLYNFFSNTEPDAIVKGGTIS